MDLKMRFLAIYLANMMLFGVVESSCKLSSRGKEFMLVVMETDDPAVTNIDLYIAAENAGWLNVSTHSGLLTSVSLSQGASNISLPNSFMHMKSGYARKGIRISSTVDIVVHLGTRGASHEVIEGALIYPIQTLSKEYIIFASATYPNGARSEFNIVGLYDNTHVEIAIVLNPPQNLYVSLDEFASYQFQSRNDISNAYLSSDKPVAVFSGNTLGHVQFGAESNFEQVPGVDTWGSRFIIPYLPGWDGYMVRVYTKHAARLNINHGSRVTMAPHNSYEFIRRYGSNVPISVSSDVPIAVVQYGDRELGHWVGDPFMAVVPPINQYQNEYEINVPFINDNMTRYLAITALTDHINELWMDNIRLTTMNVHIYNSSTRFESDNSLYRVVTVQIQPGYHRIHHSDTNVTMAILSYGRCQYCAYGYPAEMTFVKSDCSKTTPTTSTTPTTTPTTSTTSTTTPTTTSITTPVLTTTTARVGLGCFSCRNMVHMKYCDHIEYCNPYQVCYVQRYAISGGEWRYSSGCMNTNPCHQNIAIGRRGTDGSCMECCSSNFCNSHGCGDTGLPSPPQRPPLCFDCTHMGRTDECHSILHCAPGQVCSIHEYAWGAESYFTQGCADTQCLADGRSICNRCCSEDFCNAACNVTMGTAPFVG